MIRIGSGNATATAAGLESAADKTKLDALAQSSFVYRPGGVAAGNVYTTLLAAYTAAHNSGAFCDLVIDDSLSPGNAVSGAAGVLDLTRINLVGGTYSKNYSPILFTFQTGTTVPSSCWRAVYNLEVHSTSNAPITVQTGAGQAAVQRMVLYDTIWHGGTAAHFFHLVDVDGNTEVDWYLYDYCALHDGAFRIAQADAGTYSTATLLSSSGIFGSPFGGAGNFDATIESNAARITLPFTQSNVSGPQTVTYGALAGELKYTANPAGNWASSAPTTVQDAIDRIATKLKALNGGTAIP